MTTYATGNPLGSTSPKDLFDNAQNLDYLLVGPNQTYPDRLGVPRKSWYGMEVEFAEAQAQKQAAFDAFILSSGYQDLGDYDDGPITLTERNQIFRKDGELWKAAAPLALPYTTVENWAIDAPKFVSVGDAALRQELASNAGAALVALDYGQQYPKDTVGSALGVLANTKDWFSRRVMGPFFHDDAGNNSIFDGATRAVQGLVILDTPAGPKLFMTSRPTGDTQAANERCRVVEFNYEVSTGQSTYVQFTGELAIGHGEALGGYVDNAGQVWLYTSQSNLDGVFVGANGRKGFSRIKYKGTATTQADVTSYNLFGLAGSAHELSEYVNGTVGLSTDGTKVLIAADSARELTGRTMFIYDRAAVEGAANPLTVRPLHRFRMQLGNGEGYGCVGVAADEYGIYAVCGGKPFGDHGVVVHDWSGRFVRDVPMDDARGEYTYDQLMGGDNTTPNVFELEGATMYQNKLHFVCLEAWRTVGDVVSFAYNDKTANFTPISTGVVGIYPYDSAYWVPTDKAASGPFNPLAPYSRGGTLTTYRKRVYAISPFQGAGYRPINGRFLQRSSAMILAGSNSFNAYTYGYPGILRFMGWNENTKAHKRTMEYNNGTLRFWDTAAIGEYNRFGGVRAKYQGNARFMSVQAAGGDETTGARTVWFGGTDTELPGGLKEFVAGSSSVIVRQVTTEGEHTVRNLAAVSAVMNLRRVGVSGEILKFQLASEGTTYGSVAASSSNFQIVAKNGTDLCLSTSSDDGTGYQPRWRVNGADYAFLPGQDNTYSIGRGSARAKDLFVASGVINTSDATKKTPVRQLTVFEIAAAVALAGEIGAYQWLDMVAEKGVDVARQHIGMTVQRAIEVMKTHGLDPMRYGFICHDKWEAQPEIVNSWADEWDVWEDVWDEWGDTYDDEGNLLAAAGRKLTLAAGRKLTLAAGSEVVQEACVAGELYSFRGDELYAFIAAGQRARLDAMEARLAALEPSSF